MNVDQLRKALADLPGDMPVAVASECGWSELNLYVEDANFYQSPTQPSLKPWLSSGHVDTASPVYKNHSNTTALLFSEWGSDGVDITPRQPGVVEGELASLAIEEGL